MKHRIKNNFDKLSKAKNLFKNIKDEFIFVIYQDQTFETKFSLKLSKIRFLLLASLLFLISVAVSSFIIVFTPIKYYVPGMSDSYNRSDYIKLVQLKNKLEETNRANEIYINNLKQVLTGEFHADKKIKDQNEDQIDTTQ
ncbi:MAG: hypothetical protein MUE53_05125 [Chitinophagales bacterium]|jgi:hypothetical protein|nr:hypothetical protein [Chitinophagales bacterium]